MFGRDVEGWAGEAVRWGELGGEEEGEEELGFAGAAGGGLVGWGGEGDWGSGEMKIPLAGYFGDVAGGDAAAEGGV